MKRNLVCTLLLVLAIALLTACNDKRNARSGDSEMMPNDYGFDSGPNIEYREEYIPQGDPGEYLSTSEAADFTFRKAKEDGNIPEYSNITGYTMVLVGIETIEGVNDDECYLYRLDISVESGEDGSTRTVSYAVFAYDYQSGDIYMQDDESRWVIIYIYGSGEG